MAPHEPHASLQPNGRLPAPEVMASTTLLHSHALNALKEATVPHCDSSAQHSIMSHNVTILFNREYYVAAT